MLAKTYGAGPSCQYTPGMIVQPKLNGIRALYCNGTFVSRDGEQWSTACLTHLRNDLSHITDICLDGELYCHGLPLQTINSRIAVVRTTPHADERSIQFHVFDYVSREPCVVRLLQLSRMLRETEHVKLVASYIPSSPSMVESHYKHFKTHGYEGMMYRCPYSPYAIPGEHPRKDNRVHWLLKRKDWFDLDAVIVGLESGEGKHANTLSRFVLRWNNKEFRVSSGPTDAERLEYWQLGDALLGQRCKIEYRELTEHGTPFHGRIVYVELPRIIL